MHRIIFGDAEEVLAQLPAQSVDMCATSPPYWGLRDYGIETQLGLEATPEEYVERLVAVFREVRRVLKPGGTVWLNLGDSYASIGRSARHESPGVGAKQARKAVHREVKWKAGGGSNYQWWLPGGIKPKDRVGIPWRVAFALQADGWWLRNDIIWAKPNPMPESVTDRFSSTYEHVFLLAKNKRYWFDLDAVREEHSVATKRQVAYEQRANATSARRPGELVKGGDVDKGTTYGEHTKMINPLGTNPGDVWHIATQPTSYAHFATWPEELVERMLKAGCPPKVCSQCGEPWEHRVERTDIAARSHKGSRFDAGKTGTRDGGERTQQGQRYETTDLGYQPACFCGTEHPIPPEELAADPTLMDDFEIEPPPPLPGTVLDPFVGSGTTTQVARKLRRRSIGIELNAEYEAVMRQRLGLPEEGTLFDDEDLGVEFVQAKAVAEAAGGEGQ